MIKKFKYLVVVFNFLLLNNSHAQKDTAFLDVSIKDVNIDSIILTITFTSNYYSGLSVVESINFFDLVCGFGGGIRLEIEKLMGNCFIKESFDCSPTPETFKLRDKSKLKYGDTFQSVFNISDLFGKLNNKVVGVYRLKIYYYFYYFNMTRSIVSDWIYYKGQ